MRFKLEQSKSEFDIVKYRFPIYSMVIEMHGNHDYDERHMEHERENNESMMHRCGCGRMDKNSPMGHGNMRFRGLRPIVLDLINDSPKKGSEIMTSVEEKTDGRWKPSPGSVYPMLAGMETEGLIHKNPDGRYSIAESGKREMEFHKKTMIGFGRRGMPDTVEGILSQMTSYIGYFNDIADELTEHKSSLTVLRDSLSDLINKISSKRENENVPQ